MAADVVVGWTGEFNKYQNVFFAIDWYQRVVHCGIIVMKSFRNLVWHCGCRVFNNAIMLSAAKVSPLLFRVCDD